MGEDRAGDGGGEGHHRFRCRRGGGEGKHGESEVCDGGEGGSRGQIDKALRRNRRKGYGGDGGDGDGGGGYLYTERVAVERILCNLAHVHLPSALDPVSKDQPPPTLNHTTRLSADNGTTATATTPLPPKNIVSVGGGAKHLCSVGTDLTRKSLSPVSTRIKSCVFATCCHGVYDWGDYISRDYLREVQGVGGGNGGVGIGGKEEAVGEGGRRFGKKQFDLMKRWAAGSFRSGGDHYTPAAVAVASSSRNNDDGTKNAAACPSSYGPRTWPAERKG